MRDYLNMWNPFKRNYHLLAIIFILMIIKFYKGEKYPQASKWEKDI